MMEIEHRKYDRYLAPENAFALLQLGVKSLLGPIKNISRGGLLFEYFINDENQTDTGSEKESKEEIDIFSLERNFYLPGISCKVIHDSELEPTSLIATVLMMRCGVQFEELTRQEADSLVSLLTHCKPIYCPRTSDL